MATHRQIHETGKLYFVTFTCYKWLSLIEESKLYDYFPNWCLQLSRRGIKTSAYVFMPNHIHLLVFIDHSCNNPNRIIGDSKRFLAYEIVKRLKNQDKQQLLKTLKSGVAENERIKGKIHQVFIPSFDAKEITSTKMMHQTVDYIHHNPVSKKWNLIDNYIKYPYSSANFYEDDGNSQIHIFDFRSIDGEEPSESSFE